MIFMILMILKIPILTIKEFLPKEILKILAFMHIQYPDFE